MTGRNTFPQMLDVYSRRDKTSDGVKEQLTQEFKNRVSVLSFNTFHKDHDIWEAFWNDLYTRLLYVLGQPMPVPQDTPRSHYKAQQAILNYVLKNCSDAKFFDYIETVCRSDFIWPMNQSTIKLSIGPYFVDGVNEFLKFDDLPFHLTDFEFHRDRQGHISLRPTTSTPSTPLIVTYPQIIRRDSDILHTTAIKPTLTLLRQSGFASANKEFLEALADYRSGDFDDCVAKCGSSFESVMKIICASKGWPYQENNTAETLLDTIMSKTKLKPFFKHSMMSIASIRNQLGSAHGAGTESRETARHVAQYAINATASAILLLVGEANP